MLDLDNFLDSRAAEMVPGGIVFTSFISRHDAANPENQLNPECAIVLFSVLTSKTLGTTSLTMYVKKTILYPLGEPIF
jgi:hypothetical protein